MIDSLSELIIASLITAWIFRKIHIPELVGILFVGVLFGPYVFNLLNADLLDVSGEFRVGALIVILLRAGFELSKDNLKKAFQPWCWHHLPSTMFLLLCCIAY